MMSANFWCNAVLLSCGTGLAFNTLDLKVDYGNFHDKKGKKLHTHITS